MLYATFQVVFPSEGEAHFLIELAGGEIAGNNVNSDTFVALLFCGLYAELDNLLTYALSFALVKDGERMYDHIFALGDICLPIANCIITLRIVVEDKSGHYFAVKLDTV